MNIQHIIAATTIAVAAAGVGAGTVAAGDYAHPTDPPPPTIGELATPDEPAESTTCEGTVSCRLLEGACGLVGGTYTGWESRDHGHTHGICTWPWE